nr:MAG TPA: hypothetical protein [Bacteriophage sp.]
MLYIRYNSSSCVLSNKTQNQRIESNVDILV